MVGVAMRALLANKLQTCHDQLNAEHCKRWQALARKWSQRSVNPGPKSYEGQ